MHRSIPRLCAACLAAALFSSAQAAVMYSLADDGTTLLRFNSANPLAVTTVGPISGATTVLDGLDFRPRNGVMYGYSAATGGIYSVDVGTGLTKLESTATAKVGTNLLGIDFNPAADRLRVVTLDGENHRINVANGVTLVDGTLAYAAGDRNAGVAPKIADAAYINNDNNPATATQLYYLDVDLDTLVTTANPNGGVLDTVGSLGVDVSDFLGFDIMTDMNGFNRGFATLQVGGVDGLYSIDLGSGAATFLGPIGARNLFGLAIAVPEPGSIALLAAAGLGAIAVRRRKPAPAR